MDRSIEDVAAEKTPEVEPARAPAQELQPELLDNLQTLGAGNYVGLAYYLDDYPQYRDQIITWANEHMGNQVVHQAMVESDRRFINGELKQLEGESEEEWNAYMMGQITATSARRDEAAGVVKDDHEATDKMVAAMSEKEADAYIHGLIDGDAVEPAPLNFDPAPAVESPPAQQEQAVEAVAAMSPDDTELLGATLAATPEAHTEIVAEATEQLGTEAVTEALVVEQVEQEAKAEAPVTETAAAEEAKLEEEPVREAQHSPWFTGAQRYNERHAEFAAEFAILTGATMLDDGSLDPNFVAAWQGMNDVAPDGRVGPLTLAAARQGAAKQPEVTPAMVEGHGNDDISPDAYV
ncbi:MAG: hypothetical protein R3B06_08250 [Kofleriaceae bacterium]